MDNLKIIFRVAVNLQQALQELQVKQWSSTVHRAGTVATYLRNALQECGRLEKATSRDYFGAAGRCCNRLERILGEIPSSVRPGSGNVLNKPGEVVGLPFIVAEISQLMEEYDVNFGEKMDTISVITDSIVLEDINLGPFEIQLDISGMASISIRRPYCCIALEPNPAANDDSVTHPHVRDDAVCEGDGTAAIRSALEQGRLFDFFSLVVGILRTYNSGGPYVDMDEWHGQACDSCGHTVYEDSLSSCAHCGGTYCESCYLYCEECYETYCLECSVQCGHCNEYVCNVCITTCGKCESDFHSDCLNDDGICPDCEKESENENEEQKQEQNEEIVTDDKPQVSIVSQDTEARLAG